MKLDDVLQAGRVMRYHAAPIDKKQSVAEHSWGVAVCLLNEDPNVSRELLVQAILHDVAEMYTGDVPAPVKQSNSAIKETFDVLEDAALDLMDVELPFIDDAEHRMLKRADYLEGQKYCEHRIQAGDLNAIPVRDRYMVYLEKFGG